MTRVRRQHRLFEACSLLALATILAAPDTTAQSKNPAAAALAGSRAQARPQDPREWLPVEETLRFKVEVTVGPVRGLDVGSVRLVCKHVAASDGGTTDAAASLVEGPRLIATIDGLAEGVYLGREVNHSILVRWFDGTDPRVDYRERLRGSRSSDRELRIGTFDGEWKLQYRKDRHCKGCKDRAHYTKGVFPWSSYSHCDDCDRAEHRVWRDYTYLDVPPETFDIVSALYYARGFLRGTSSTTTVPLANHDELWNVHLTRAEARRIETDAGKFDCVRIRIGPQLARGDGPGKSASARFDALFGLHGDISVWVDRSRGFPVVIEGTAPVGPFELHVKASLVSHRGG